MSDQKSMAFKPPRPRVLYVDDQVGNLTVFRASVRRFADVKTVSSGEEALKLLETEEFPIVISDQRMAGLSGTELLIQVRKMYPDSIRILLTAHSDFSAVIDAINEGQIARFVKKPWNRDEMRAILEDANALYWKTRENKALTEQFVQQARLAAVGQMTAGFAHELLNLTCKLHVIDDLARRYGPPLDGADELRIVKNGVDGVTSLADAVRSLANGRPQELDLRSRELNGLVERWMVTLKLLPAVRRLRRLTFTPAAQPVHACIDADRLELILINLVKNAAEAVPEGEGVVEVELCATDGRVSLHVRDNGPGIPHELRSNLGQTLFTTKGEQGTGLGLLMSRSLAIAQGGELQFWSGESAGTTFTLSFEESEAPAERLSA